MRSRLNIFRDHDATYKLLAPLNHKDIVEYNERMLSILSLMGSFLMILPLLAVPFSDSKSEAVPIYLIAGFLSFILFLFSRLPALKKYSVIGLYLFFSGAFLFAIYLSVIHSPNMRATILLGAFSIVPMCFIDRPIRINLFVVFWMVIHTLLALNLKPQYALDDAINILAFVILGSYIGNIIIMVRLESFEAHRQLTIQKETDVLTGLSNRRKLFDTLIALETTDVERPSGIMMIDIDHFKDFNDNYGHAAGDKCLNLLGEVFMQFAHNFRLDFYRYGGEEFVAIAYGYGASELMSIAESLRIAVQSTDMNGHTTTISIGVTYCGDEDIRNYESVIDRADKASYEAKHAGRNRVVMEQKPI